MSNPRPLIHIGYPKAASTWLQQVIFKDGNAGFIAPWGVHSLEALKQFAFPNPFRFSAESARQVFEPGLQEAARKNLVPVLSREALVGNPIWGHYWGKDVADRMHAVFPEAKIFIIIREQKSMLMSCYRHYIKVGGTATLQQFIGLEGKRSHLEGTCRLDFFEFHLLLDYYLNLFGTDNVLILPFELLKLDPPSFCQKFFDFAGSQGTPDLSQASKNVGYKGGWLTFRRQLNFLAGPGSHPLLRRIKLSSLSYKVLTEVEKILPEGIDQSLEEEWKEAIDKHVGNSFAESNQLTSKLIGMNLGDLGYAC